MHIAELMMPTSYAKYILCKVLKCLILCWERISFHRQCNKQELLQKSARPAAIATFAAIVYPELVEDPCSVGVSNTKSSTKSTQLILMFPVVTPSSAWLWLSSVYPTQSRISRTP